MNQQTVQSSRSEKKEDFFQRKQLLNTKSLPRIQVIDKETLKMVTANHIIAVIAITMTGITVWAGDLQVMPLHKPWEVTENEGAKNYILTTSGKNTPGLFFKQTVKPDSYYKISWKMKSSIEEKKARFRLKINLSGRYGYQIGVLPCNWSEYNAYFYSGKADTVKLTLSVAAMDARTIAIKELKIMPVAPDAFSKNLLPDGDFEKGGGIPVNWRKLTSTKGPNPAVIAEAQGFISGEKSLEIDFVRQKGRAGIMSINLPIIPGDEFEFRFWTKSEKDYVIAVRLTAWSPFDIKGGHLYNGKFKTTPEWKKYRIRFKVPAESSSCPYLKDRLMFIDITAASKQSGKVWFDDMVFHKFLFNELISN